MRILIDGYEANVEQRLGSSQVAFEIICNLEKIDHQNEYTILLPTPPMSDFPRERVGFKYEILKPKKLWTRIALPFFLYKNRKKFDLIFSPTHYIPLFSPIPRVVTIFDLSFLHFPESFLKKDLWQLKNWTKFSAKNADHIITISNTSKKDVVNEYGVKKDKVTVIFPGYKKEAIKKATQEEIKMVKSKYDLGDSYILYIGTVQPRKNLLRLIEAVSRIKDLELVIVGKTSGVGRQGWKYEEILAAPKRYDVENRIKFLGFVPVEDLSGLITGAKVFIQPSLWEGFGIPVLEAMACGTPVLISDNSSLPEVAGNAGLKFDPYSVDQIEQAIRTVVTDLKLRQKLSKASLKRVGRFSWKKTAREVLKVFEQVH